MAILNLYKPMGWTPLQTMDALRKSDRAREDDVMVYAGRLDPMAEGVLVVLTNEDRYSLDEFLGKDKTYEATILFGFRSDTYDILGIARRGEGELDHERARVALEQLKGTHPLQFPPYSAFRIKGKPLHWWAREGRLDELEVPIKDMEVLEVRDVDVFKRGAGEVLREIEERVDRVDGDFRQLETLESWKVLLEGKRGSLMMATVTLDVSSGTYIRSIVHSIGDELGVGALLYNLKRNKVGEFESEDSIKVQ